jgi:hypothetical protein
MAKTAFLLALVVSALVIMPAQAQPLRVFVSGLGSDSNPCTEAQPCRTFQKAHNTAAANGEIQVLDPSGYGPLTINKGISIQGHGFGAITQTCNTCVAITISVTTSDPVSLNGLLLDGGGTGQFGINITSGASVQILNSVIRRFFRGIVDATTTNGSTLLIEDTIVSDIGYVGICLCSSGANLEATLNRITVNQAAMYGVFNNANATIANSVISNNSTYGLFSNTGTTWLAKAVISGNATGVFVGVTVFSYGDNYINNVGLR